MIWATRPIGLVTAGHTVVEQARHAGDWLVGTVLGEPLTADHSPVIGDGHSSSAWRSPSRLWSGALGSVLLFYGLGRRRVMGKLAMTIGLGLLAEGLFHHSTSESFGEEAMHPMENHAAGEVPGETSPARGQPEDASPSWKVAVP